MWTRSKPLTAAFVKTVKQPGRYGDGGRGSFGLYLRVWHRPNGRVGKSWGQRITIDGRRTNLGLGPAAFVSLAGAREKARENARLAYLGQDPRCGRGIPTFEAATEAVIELRRPTWKPGGRSEQQWRSAFKAHVFPGIGGSLVTEISSGDVLALLTADDLWNRRRATARRLLQWIGLVFRRAIAEGHRTDNPVDAIRAALPAKGQRVRHQRSIHWKRVPEAITAIRASTSLATSRLCLEWIVLTGCRSAEAREARWIEVRDDVWVLSPERTKNGRQHRIPLSEQALAVLNEARSLPEGSGLIFPGATGRPLEGKTLSELTRRLQFGSPHGFRTALRSYLADSGVSREVAEACLGHAVRNQAEAAYRHGTDLLEQRRGALRGWARHVSP